MDESEFRDIQRLARRQRMTVAEWVRQSLRAARRRTPVADPKKKLDAVRASLRHSFPTADIDQMLAEVERGYLGKAPR